MSATSPCLTCGACCAFFRVSFYWGEAQSAGGVVPDQLTHQVNHAYSCMRGTESASPRCHALMGDVGSHVRCSIYDNRPSTCHEFTCHSDTPQGNPDCNRARAAYGLPPLSLPDDQSIQVG